MAVADPLLDAALAGDERAFQRLVEPYREMLEVHCYRMLGSLQDAEDRLQETLLRAWQRLGSFERRSSLKTWLYRIATNACLDEIDRRPRRPDLVDPFPDDRVTEPLADPAARYAHREGMELAFLTAIQRLPGRQRAVLILRDVLGWTAPEAAELLETTTAAVNSALQRARAALDGAVPPAAAPDPTEQDLLKRYIDAWDRLDIDALVSLLRDDAVMRMPPRPAVTGARAIAEFIATRGRRRLDTTRANGRPALVMRDHGVMVLDVAGGEIAGIDVFIDPELAERFAR
ncbi:MAG TPA: sigma-70 family RNA polymerase sigma factor [Solirubrobacteraceae bacterium]|jgi:RNA polymerase sigma-70 factor (ECF subfamily)